MARGTQINIADFNVKANLPDGLEPISRPAGEAGAAQFKMGTEVEYRVGKLADEFAKAEGAKGGLTAGNDPNFRPTGMTTIRGRAFDEAAITTYTNNLEAGLDRDMRMAYQENQDNPGKLTAKLDAIKQDYATRHVFPEIAGQFNATFEKKRTTLTLAALEQQRTDMQAKARASSEFAREAIDRDHADIAAMPPGPERDRLLKENDARLRATYQNDVDNKANPVDAARAMIARQVNRDVRRVLTPIEGITDPEAYAAAGRKAIDDASKGIKNQAALDTLEIQLAKGVNQRATDAKQSEAKLTTLTNDQFDRASKGAVISERENADLRAAAKTPAEKAIVETGIRRSTAAAQISFMSPLQLGLEEQRLAIRAREQGLTKEDAEQLALIQQVKAARTKIVQTDPIGDAAARGVIKLPALEPNLANSNNPMDQAKLTNQFLLRRPYKDYTDNLGGADNRMTVAERDQVRATLARGGAPAENMIKAIVQGMGPQAPAVLREVGGEDLLHVGVLAAMPGPSRDATVKDIVNGAALLNNEDLKPKLPKPPDTADTVFNKVFGETVGSEDKARLMRTATTIYTNRAYKAGVTKDDVTASEAIFSEALRDAAGQATDRQGKTFGGPASYSPNWYTWSKKVIAPPNVRADKFGNVIGAIREEDLEGAENADGSKITASQVKNATPVATPQGYKFALGDPASKDPKFLGKPGAPLIIDFSKLEGRLRTRVPDAFP
jgi:hypothetical protein